MIQFEKKKIVRMDFTNVSVELHGNHGHTSWNKKDRPNIVEMEGSNFKCSFNTFHEFENVQLIHFRIP